MHTIKAIIIEQLKKRKTHGQSTSVHPALITGKTATTSQLLSQLIVNAIETILGWAISDIYSHIIGPKVVTYDRSNKNTDKRTITEDNLAFRYFILRPTKKRSNVNAKATKPFTSNYFLPFFVIK